MSVELERKRLVAIARANEVFDALTRIASLRDFVRTVVERHDVENLHNAERRDCAAFHNRIDELALRDLLRMEGIE